MRLTTVRGCIRATVRFQTKKRDSKKGRGGNRGRIEVKIMRRDDE
jgi:hypothetical protein